MMIITYILYTVIQMQIITVSIGANTRINKQTPDHVQYVQRCIPLNIRQHGSSKRIHQTTQNAPDDIFLSNMPSILLPLNPEEVSALKFDAPSAIYPFHSNPHCIHISLLFIHSITHCSVPFESQSALHFVAISLCSCSLVVSVSRLHNSTPSVTN